MRAGIVRELAGMGRELASRGLVTGPGGNISAREGARVYISPSGRDVDGIPDDGWSVLDLESGELLEGPRPASEWELHLRCLRARPETVSVCHAHPPWATGFVSGGREIEPFTPDFIAYVDRIAHVPFIRPAGPELALAVEGKVKEGANAVCLRNHGVVTLGRTVREALVRMLLVEDHAKLQVAAVAAGDPRPLTREEQEMIRNMEVEAYRRKLMGGEKERA
jgi:L-fuculose-phosphate aldolase